MWVLFPLRGLNSHLESQTVSYWTSTVSTTFMKFKVHPMSFLWSRNRVSTLVQCLQDVYNLVTLVKKKRVKKYEAARAEGIMRPHFSLTIYKSIREWLLRGRDIFSSGEATGKLLLFSSSPMHLERTIMKLSEGGTHTYTHAMEIEGQVVGTREIMGEVTMISIIL